MQALPANLTPYRRTPGFNHSSVAPGPLKWHSSKPGIWGKSSCWNVILTNRIPERVPEQDRLDPDHDGMVEPTIRHAVQPQNGVKFYVQFYRRAHD